MKSRDGMLHIFLYSFRSAVRLKKKDDSKSTNRDRESVRFLLSLLIIYYFAAASLRSSVTPPAAGLGKFPAVEATSLDHAQLNLPQNFAGQLNLVIISFAREQQQVVDTWLPAAQQIQATHNNFRYYELPTTARENLLYRWWFNSALRSNTTDKDLRSRILTTYVNKHEFRNSLHISNERHVVEVLVDQTGRVLWRADGPYTEANKAELLSAVTASGL